MGCKAAMISPIGETKVNNAFTLVEILLVTIITGIVLALAAPNFSKGYSRFQLNKTTDDLLMYSRWAQAMAIGQERIYALSFSKDQRSYSLTRVAADDQDSFEPVKGTLGRMHPVPDAIRLVMAQPYDSKGTGSIDRIEFYPDGTIDPATIQLVSPEQKTVLSSVQVRGMMTKVDSE
jgi:prepilin-type N-terminal cleavage/methylation domain-containing protein